MDDRLEKPTDEGFDLDDLLHPARGVFPSVGTSSTILISH